MRDIVLFAGSSHPELAKAIAERLGIPLGACKLGKFSNKETSVQIMQSVRDLDVFIIQSSCGHVNDNLMELLVMISACRMASARKITVVIPMFPYSRQPDLPYKRNGLPRRVPVERVWSTPTVKQRVQLEEERYQASLRRKQQQVGISRSSSRERSPSPSGAHGKNVITRSHLYFL
jgi:ribose-phosphate pyrophosphokinase